MNTSVLRKDEEISLSLRTLFEEVGFRRTNVSEFEEYDLYVDYRNFFQSSNVITFMDASGRPMALRPDVTLSIIKNTPPEHKNVAEKLYYMESVYRFAKENQEYYRINQIGVEALGGDSALENIEVIALTLDSLATITPDFMLDLSHMGFVSGLLDALHLTAEVKAEVYQFLHQKNLHDLGELLAKAGVSKENQERVLRMASLSGPIPEVVAKAREIVVNKQMEEALNELEALHAGLCRADVLSYMDRVRLDFSVVNDLDYYNSLIFSGYVSKIHRVILLGGRYDRLMESMGKKQGGIGFALSLDDIHRRYGEKSLVDVDKVLFYGPEIDLGVVVRAVRDAREDGGRVRAEKEEAREELPYRYQSTFTIREDGTIEEEKSC